MVMLTLNGDGDVEDEQIDRYTDEWMYNKRVYQSKPPQIQTTETIRER
jgi:hypothetical protein